MTRGFSCMKNQTWHLSVSVRSRLLSFSYCFMRVSQETENRPVRQMIYALCVKVITNFCFFLSVDDSCIPRCFTLAPVLIFISFTLFLQSISILSIVSVSCLSSFSVSCLIIVLVTTDFLLPYFLIQEWGQWLHLSFHSIKWPFIFFLGPWNFFHSFFYDCILDIAIGHYHFFCSLSCITLDSHPLP